MKRLTYEIINHGVDQPSTFLGCGVVGTEFTHKATGSGSSAQEAGRDAHEIFWQSEADFKEVALPDLAKLEKEIEALDEAEDAHDGCTAVLGDDVPDHEDCEAAHYVSIRWAVKEGS